MPNYKELSSGELQGLASQGDCESYYWLGMDYWGRGDYGNAVIWLEKTMNNPGNEWAAKAKNNLALAHEGGYHPNADKDEAIRLYGELDGYAMPKLHLGFLYYEGTPRNHDPARGKQLIETAVGQLKKQNNGSDEYLSQIECFKIGGMYYQERMPANAIEYFEKAIKRSDSNYASDRKLIEMAKESISECRSM